MVNLLELMKIKYWLRNYFDKYPEKNRLFHSILRINCFWFDWENNERRDSLHNEWQNVHYYSNDFSFPEEDQSKHFLQNIFPNQFRDFPISRRLQNRNWRYHRRHFHRWYELFQLALMELTTDCHLNISLSNVFNNFFRWSYWNFFR